MDALVKVRACIARALHGDITTRANAPGATRHATPDATLGEVQLRPHQLDAVRRLREALRNYGGALLADAPGLGKSYVALAIAREHGGAMVIAPAGLREQWLRFAQQADVRIEWRSIESLSRRPAQGARTLLVFDEAHHLRNPATRRYANAAALAVGRQVLLLTATPVHNRPRERDALLALFLGAGSKSIAPQLSARLVIRRVADPALRPTVRATRWFSAPRSAGIAAAVRALPPPLPAADGRHAVALTKMTLAHAWSSSIAALDDAVRRAIHRARALDDALGVGRWPTRAELRAWTGDTSASQLAFPELVATPAAGDLSDARRLVAAHLEALATLRTITATRVETDAAHRAESLARIMRVHPGATIIAFARYAGTITALWRGLRTRPGVVALTATGVRSAGGGLTRRDVLSALAAPHVDSARAPLRLVLSTDLLGEGLDLRAASVVVHLDQPWTPAVLEQREGRAARLSSPHAAVWVYAFRAPRDAARILALEQRLSTKRLAMRRALSEGSAREALLACVRPWLATASSERAIVATVQSARRGWVAVVRDAAGHPRVIASAERDRDVTEDDARVLALLRASERGGRTTNDGNYVRMVRRAVHHWLTADASARVAAADTVAASRRAAMMRILDRGLRATPVHQRAAMEARVADARARLATLRGVGVERALAEALRLDSFDASLGAIDRLATSLEPPRPAIAAGRVLALLLFVQNEGPGA